MTEGGRAGVGWVDRSFRCEALSTQSQGGDFRSVGRWGFQFASAFLIANDDGEEL
jgi:hypothetical protein